jgi:DNA-binding transcriptional ArsR family regulator
MELADLSRLLHALADPARLRLLALCRRGELSVNELTAATDMSQPRVSRHLRILVEAGALRRFREAHWVYYRLAGDSEAAGLVRESLQRLGSGDEALRADARRLDEVLAERAREARAAAGGDSEAALPPAAWARLEEATRLIAHQALGAAGLGDLLDIGTGAGRMLRLLGPDARKAIGVDISRPMRLAARNTLRDAGLSHCSVRDADMYALPFEPSSFDTVVLARVLTGAQQPWSATLEAARVLRPGGHLLVVDLLPDGMPVEAWCRSLRDWLAAAGLVLETEQRLVLPRGIAVIGLTRGPLVTEAAA